MHRITPLLGFVVAVALGAAVGAQRPTLPAAASATSDGMVTSWFANGAVRERGPVDATGARTGTWEAFWPNGCLASRGTYANGRRDGVWRLHDPYGRLAETVWHGETSRVLSRVPPAERVPLRVADLRGASAGLTTVGAAIDRWLAAGDGPDGDAIRREAERALADAPHDADAALRAAVHAGGRSPPSRVLDRRRSARRARLRDPHEPGRARAATRSDAAMTAARGRGLSARASCSGSAPRA